MTRISTLLALFFLTTAAASAMPQTHNHFRGGSATINILFAGDTALLPQCSALMYAADPFSENHASQEYEFEKNAKGLTANIPLLTNESMGIIRLSSSEGKPYGIGLINISQEKPLNITAIYYAENDSMGFEMSNTDGLNRYSIGINHMNKSLAIGQAFNMITSIELLEYIINNSGLLSADDFSSWQKYSNKIEPVRQQYYAFAGIDEIDVPEVQPWLENNVKRYYICNWPMNFVRNAGYVGVNAPKPPLEFYSFLDSLDLSHHLLDYYPDLPPFYLLKQILLKVPGIEPIGENAIGQWKQQARSILSQVISQPLDLLLDMLATASYIMQIRDENQPLTSIQKANITEEGSSRLPAPLISYLLEMNQTLESQLSTPANLYDLSDESAFSLSEFIDTNYLGKPVVVDLWNTWCQPCLNAHQKSESLRHLPEFEDVVFLFISDDSSPMSSWQSLAPTIGGVQLRISQEARNALFASLSMEPMFPTYLFYDASHTLIHAAISYPGNPEYLRLLQQISSTTPSE